jgi:hypothetical protein
MTERERKRLWRTAVHEAGHAVAAFTLGLPFRWVSVKPDPETGSLGHVVGLNGSAGAIYDASVGDLKPGNGCD